MTRSTFAALAEHSPDGEPYAADWRYWLASLAVGVWPGRSGLDSHIESLIKEVIDLDQGLGFELEAQLNLMESTVQEFGMILGYALGRTQPADLRAMDGWVDEATRYAGLDDWAEGERTRYRKDAAKWAARRLNKRALRGQAKEKPEVL